MLGLCLDGRRRSGPSALMSLQVIFRHAIFAIVSKFNPLTGSGFSWISYIHLAPLAGNVFVPLPILSSSGCSEKLQHTTI